MRSRKDFIKQFHDANGELRQRIVVTHPRGGHPTIFIRTDESRTFAGHFTMDGHPFPRGVARSSAYADAKCYEHYTLSFISEHIYQPTIVRRDPRTKIVLEEVYMQSDVLHRDEQKGPARTLRDPTSSIAIREEYYCNGILHRDPELGPARTERDGTTGIATLEEYYREGKLHRNDFPARVRRDPQSGLILEQRHFMNGERVIRRSPARWQLSPVAIS